MTDLTVEEVTAATKCPADAVAANWPIILTAMQARDVASRLSQIAMASTVAVETAWRFRPIKEFGSRAYLDKYDTGPLAARLGNTPEDDDDGILYAGRGFIQLTGRANYATCGAAIGYDLLATPDLMLVAEPSAAAAAWFWQVKGVHLLAAKPDWKAVRRRVNGGTNGLVEFLEIVNRFTGLAT